MLSFPPSKSFCAAPSSAHIESAKTKRSLKKESAHNSRQLTDLCKDLCNCNQVHFFSAFLCLTAFFSEWDRSANFPEISKTFQPKHDKKKFIEDYHCNLRLAPPIIGTKLNYWRHTLQLLNVNHLQFEQKFLTKLFKLKSANDFKKAHHWPIFETWIVQRFDQKFLTTILATWEVQMNLNKIGILDYLHWNDHN